MRKFNPRDPNFLPLVPEPGAEKVDLRHQMMDERKNAEEWMLDCALRQVVDKLAPARKKKVALLVEAFEAVMPNPKCDTRLRNSSGFAHGGRIQACS
uniref:Calmodulin-binding domain-containing protein n=2 Tax=Lotus japonicus TaxID=34305 RepID=I3SS55_LOTJA|nr:unknown [Lotus japonicus]